MPGETDLHLDILNECQQQVFFHLAGAFKGTDFYLAGGTALALQIGHRPSIDFDWFVAALGEPEALFQRLRACEIAFNVQSLSIETVYLEIDTVQVSFIGYDYELLQSPSVCAHGAKLAHTDDIACMKLSAIGSRGSRKDFVDLHFMISQFRSVDEYLGLYQRKYQNRDIGHIIRSLIYFEDAEAEPEILIVQPFDWPGMKHDFERWVEELVQ
jgi:hypothetical protein